MKELIRYLAEFECTVGNLYADAAEYFSYDPDLSAFLRDLEQDEITFYDTMNRIDDMAGDRLDGYRSDVVADRKTREKLENPVIKFRERLSRGSLNEAGLVGLLMDIVYSEWNDIFIYVIETMKDSDPEFLHTTAHLEAHREKIIRFTEKRSGLAHLLNRHREVMRAWDEKILIIDDDKALLKLLTSYLRRYYEVDSTSDGSDALLKISGRYYDLIMSDLVVPEVSGIEIYREAAKYDENIAKRFLFVTGSISPEYEKFFEQEGLEYMSKPLSLPVVDEKIQEILGRGYTDPAA